MIESIDIKEALTGSFTERSANVAILYSLTNCPPCEAMMRSIDSYKDDDRSGVSFFLVKIEKEDKRAVGKAVLNGISSFPRLDYYENGTLLKSMKGVPENTTQPQLNVEVSSFISSN